jgi:hypothetical protein
MSKKKPQKNRQFQLIKGYAGRKRDRIIDRMLKEHDFK